MALSSEVCTPLEHLHSLSIVHRDIKPQNIVITRDGQLKLMDLGLGRNLNDNEQIAAESGTAVGTALYISPEQALGSESTDVRSDLYSLGATMYHLLCGQPPFPGEKTPDVLQAHLHKLPDPPANLASDIPAPLNWLILRLLEKDPENRPSTAAALRSELDSLSRELSNGNGQPISLRECLSV